MILTSNSNYKYYMHTIFFSLILSRAFNTIFADHANIWSNMGFYCSIDSVHHQGSQEYDKSATHVSFGIFYTMCIIMKYVYIILGGLVNWGYGKLWCNKQE